VSVKVLFIVIIVFKRYPSTYCLMKGGCFIYRDFEILSEKKLKIRITTFKCLSFGDKLSYYRCHMCQCF